MSEDLLILVPTVALPSPNCWKKRKEGIFTYAQKMCDVGERKKEGRLAFLFALTRKRRRIFLNISYGNRSLECEGRGP